MPSRSEFSVLNCVKFCSIVIGDCLIVAPLAICDTGDCFTLYDVCSYGSSNGNGVLTNSVISQFLETN